MITHRSRATPILLRRPTAIVNAIVYGRRLIVGLYARARAARQQLIDDWQMIGEMQRQARQYLAEQNEPTSTETTPA